jgi:hypothetical protein
MILSNNDYEFIATVLSFQLALSADDTPDPTQIIWIIRASDSFETPFTVCIAKNPG